MSDSYSDLGERGDSVSRREHLGAASAKRVVAKGFDGSSYPALKTDADGTLHVTGSMSGGGGTQIDDGDAVDTDTQGNLVLGTTAVSGTARALRCTNGGTLLVDGSAVTQPVSGTVTVNQPVAVTDNSGSLTVDGTVAVSSVGGTVVVGDGGGSITVDGTVAVTQPVAVTDNSGSLTVDGTVAVSSVAGTVVVGDGGGSLTVDGTVSVSGALDTELTTKDYDTGVGTDTVAVTGILLPASGGAVAGGTSTNPLRVDPTGATTQPVSGTVTANAGTNLNTSLLALEGGGNLATLAGVVTSARAAVNPISGQAGVQGGAGASTALTQRVALATDANTIQGTVTANAGSGTFTVDTELPAAAALAENTANPTVPGVAAFGMAYDGTNWDRVPGNSGGGLFAQGAVTSDGVDSGNPVKVGFKAASATPTAVAAADRVDAWGDLNGRQVITADYPGVSSNVTKTVSTTTAFTILSAAGAGLFNFVDSLWFSNGGSALVRFDLRDGAGGTVFWSGYLAANGGGVALQLKKGLKQPTSNTLLEGVLSAVPGANDVRINIEYHTAA